MRGTAVAALSAAPEVTGEGPEIAGEVFCGLSVDREVQRIRFVCFQS